METTFSYTYTVILILMILIWSHALRDYIWIPFWRAMFNRYHQLFIELNWFWELKFAPLWICLFAKNFLLWIIGSIIVLENLKIFGYYHYRPSLWMILNIDTNFILWRLTNRSLIPGDLFDSTDGMRFVFDTHSLYCDANDRRRQ